MIDERLTFRKFEMFLAFMKTENIGRAAEALNLSTVSVHRALHSIEEALSCPLFIHQGRGLKPLPSAYEFERHAKELLQGIHTAIEDTQRTAGITTTRMRLGTLYSLTVHTIPRLIMDMKSRRPELEFELVMGSNQKLMDELDLNRLDAIVIETYSQEIDPSRYVALDLFRDALFLAVPTSWKGHLGPEADLKDFRNEKFIALSEGFATYANFQTAFGIAGFQPQIVTRVSDIFSMISLVQAGVGIALLPGRMCSVYESTIRLVRLAAPYQISQTIGVVFSKKREHESNLLALAAVGRMFANDMRKLS